jgi:predicted alpha/beta-fold hydrolase
MQTGSNRPVFKARRLFRGRHLQTLAGFFLIRKADLPKPEERFVEVAPGVKILCHCHWQPDRGKALTVVVVHGLEGSSESGYVIGISQKGLAAGMNVVRVNQRNCGGTDHLSPTLYNSSLSGDIVAVCRQLVDDGVSRFALAGFSMGGNLVLKTAGEWGSQGPRNSAVAAVCPAMDGGVGGCFASPRQPTLRSLLHARKLRMRFSQQGEALSGSSIQRVCAGFAALRDFDDKITSVLLRLRRCGRLLRTRGRVQRRASDLRPGLILHAANDPFVRLIPETRKKIAANPNPSASWKKPTAATVLLIADANDNDGRWAEQQVIEFLRQF